MEIGNSIEIAHLSGGYVVSYHVPSEIEEGEWDKTFMVTADVETVCDVVRKALRVAEGPPMDMPGRDDMGPVKLPAGE